MWLMPMSESTYRWERLPSSSYEDRADGGPPAQRHAKERPGDGEVEKVEVNLGWVVATKATRNIDLRPNLPHKDRPWFSKCSGAFERITWSSSAQGARSVVIELKDLCRAKSGFHGLVLNVKVSINLCLVRHVWNTQTLNGPWKWNKL